MPRLLPIYLATLRKQWGLTQDELALLLSISGSNLSRIEALLRHPTVDIVLASEVVFGKPPREIFPALFEEAEDRVMAKGKVLYERLEGRTDLSSQQKLRLLTEMIKRVQVDDSKP